MVCHHYFIDRLTYPLLSIKWLNDGLYSDFLTKQITFAFLHDVYHFLFHRFAVFHVVNRYTVRRI
jgi:hypothetical protein